MSAKRRNENGQMRREEYEAQDDDAGGEGPGEFSRASDEVMKKRRIVSVSKKFGSRGGGGGYAERGYGERGPAERGHAERGYAERDHYADERTYDGRYEGHANGAADAPRDRAPYRQPRDEFRGGAHAERGYPDEPAKRSRVGDHPGAYREAPRYDPGRLPPPRRY